LLTGRIQEVDYSPGDTQHFRFEPGKFMTHDLHNIGDTELIYTTVEFLDSLNEPLSV
jgi:hypothetical protein